jgi:hypothetical protein
LPTPVGPSPVVDIFDARSALQLGDLKPPRQGLILAPDPLLIHQQAEPFQEAQLARGRVLLLCFQRIHHAQQPHGRQFFHHGFL